MSRGGCRWQRMTALPVARVGTSVPCRIRRSLVVVSAALVAVCGAAAEPSAALDLQALPGVQDPVKSDPGAPPGTKELPQLRTRDTSTYVDEDGAYITRFYQGSVNYDSPSGDWKPIDNQLVPVFTSGYAYKNKANRYIAEFPQDIKDPVRFTVGKESVAMALEDAEGTGSVTANSTSFADALPGVNVSYAAENDALKETLTLAGPAVQQSFRFRLWPSSGLSAKEALGGVDFEKDGEPVFSLAPPVMHDSSGSAEGFSTAIDMTLEKLEDGYVLTLTPDAKWLASEKRAWPVELDPSFYFRTGGECTIFSFSASPTTCRSPNTPFLYVGKNGPFGQLNRSLLRFDVEGSIPRDADVTQANLTLYACCTPAVASVGLYEVTKEWNSRVTWQTTNGTTLWSQPGGDFGSTALSTVAVTPQTGYYTWALPTSLVDTWVGGAPQNRGVLLKAAETGTDYTAFISSSYYFSTYWPQLQVTWQPKGRYTSAPTKTWVVDGGTGTMPRVNAIESQGNTLYVGGDFNFFGPRTGQFASVSTARDGTYGKIATNLDEVAGNAGAPDPNAGVRAITSDGNGGWFLGGDFKYVGGHPRARLAHILPSGAVDPTWDPQIDGSVYALARSGDDLYVGGAFATVNGAAHSKIAKLSASTGAVNPWNPGVAGGAVRSIVVAGPSQMFVGGDFTDIGTNSRKYIAAIEPQSGSPLAWYPTNGADAPVRALALGDSGTLYAGGEFRVIGGEDHYRTAKISTSSGSVINSWSPYVDAPVDALAVSGANVYVGGEFTWIAGASRNGFAALSSGGSLNTTYPDPAANSRVRAIVVNGSMVYVAGDFQQIGGQYRRYAAAVNAAANPAPSVDSWNPNLGNEAYALALSSDATPRVGVGGRFRSANGVVRRNLAALNPSTGQPTSWNPAVSGGPVNALELAEGNLYVGGSFTTAAGQPRSGLAAFTTATNELTNWNPQASNVQALRVAKGRLYVGADWMESINDTPTRRVNYAGAYKLGGGTRPTGNPGSYQASFGELTIWQPGPDGVVTDIETDGKVVYIAGNFSQVGTYSKPNLAAVDGTTGFVWPVWGPAPDGPVLDMAVTEDALYIGGSFAHIAGAARSNVAALKPVKNLQWPAEVMPWNPGADKPVEALAVDGAGVYLGGRFTSVGGVSRTGLAGTDLSGAVLDFSPKVQVNADPSSAPVTSPRAIEISDQRLYVGGDYYGVETTAQTAWWSP